MLKNYLTYFKARFGSKKGQGMVEYGLILGLIAVVVIVVLSGIGTNLVSLFTTIKDKLTTATPAG